MFELLRTTCAVQRSPGHSPTGRPCRMECKARRYPRPSANPKTQSLIHGSRWSANPASLVERPRYTRSDRSCVCPDGLACHPPNTRLPRSQCFLRAVCLITWPHGLAMSSESSPTVAARGSVVVRRCRAVGFADLAFHALHAIGSSRSIRHVLYVPCHVPYAQVRLL